MDFVERLTYAALYFAFASWAIQNGDPDWLVAMGTIVGAVVALILISSVSKETKKND